MFSPDVFIQLQEEIVAILISVAKELNEPEPNPQRSL